MERKTTYLEWVKSLPEDDSQYSSCRCPECNSIGLSYQYFGFENSEFGWKLVWCDVCKSGIRISRTKVPKNAVSLIDENDQKEFADKYTELVLIT